MLMLTTTTAAVALLAAATKIKHSYNKKQFDTEGSIAIVHGLRTNTHTHIPQKYSRMKLNIEYYSSWKLRRNERAEKKIK